MIVSDVLGIGLARFPAPRGFYDQVDGEMVLEHPDVAMLLDRLHERALDLAPREVLRVDDSPARVPAFAPKRQLQHSDQIDPPTLVSAGPCVGLRL